MSNFRTRFSERIEDGLTCTAEERMTQSEFADECDINQIMARYHATGELPDSARAAAARFGDFSQVPSFAEMQDKIIAAHELFAALPAAVRKQFDHDPGQFIAAADTEEGRKMLVDLGLGMDADEAPSTPPAAPPVLSAGQAQGAGTEPAPAPDKGARSNRSPKPSEGG